MYVSTATYRLVRTVSERIAYFVEPVASAGASEPEWFSLNSTADFRDYDEAVAVESPDYYLTREKPSVTPTSLGDPTPTPRSTATPKPTDGLP